MGSPVASDHAASITCNQALTRIKSLIFQSVVFLLVIPPPKQTSDGEGKGLQVSFGPKEMVLMLYTDEQRFIF